MAKRAAYLKTLIYNGALIGEIKGIEKCMNEATERRDKEMHFHGGGRTICQVCGKGMVAKSRFHKRHAKCNPRAPRTSVLLERLEHSKRNRKEGKTTTYEGEK